MKIPRPIQWLFESPSEPVTALRVIGWWELRRIPYNFAIGAFGIVSLLIFFVSISASGHLQPGDDAIEPLALFAAPFVANVCYTAGWLLDIPLRYIRPSLSPGFTPLLFCLGLGFSFVVISLPAIFWSGYRLLQILRFLP
jgi:hypothetical protein